MSTTILTDEQIRAEKYNVGVIGPDQFFNKVARAIEQAVLQSPEVQAWKRDAERYRWTTALDDNAETLYSIVLSYGGDQAKINERVDAYRPDAATKEQP